MLFEFIKVKKKTKYTFIEGILNHLDGLYDELNWQNDEKDIEAINKKIAIRESILSKFSSQHNFTAATYL